VLMETSPGTSRAERQRQRALEIVRRHYHDRGWRHPYEKYEALLAEVLAKGSVVLDVGCGRVFPLLGHLLRCGAVVHGIDPVPQPQSAPPGVTLKQGDAEKIPYDNCTFDVVTSRCVLEHLVRPLEVFREFRRVLRPGGHVVFLTANKYDYVSCFAAVVPNRLHGRIVKAVEGRDEKDTFPTYYRANSARRIRRLAGDAGLEVRGLEYLSTYPYLFTFSPFLCRIAIAYDELIRGVQPLNWLQGWILGCLRRSGD